MAEKALPQKTIDLFSSKLERVNLFFPFVFIALIFGEIISGYKFSSVEKNTAMFAAKLIFLNHVHVYMSLCMILFVPEIKEWVKAEKARNSYFQIRWLLVFLGVFSLFSWGIPFFLETSTDQRVYKLATMLIALVGLHHNYSQSLGLSLVYNRKIQAFLTSASRTQSLFKKLEFFERRFFTAMMCLSFGFLVMSSIGLKNTLLADIFNYGNFACAASLLGISFLYPGRLSKNKKIYMIRFAIYPLLPHSYIALVAILSIHGFEYLCVYLKMQNTAVLRNDQNKRRIFSMSFFIILSLTILTISDKTVLGWWLQTVFTEHPIAFLYLGALSSAGSYLHYHIDSLMFKMKDPITRNMIGPLLLDEPPASTVHIKNMKNDSFAS